MSRFCIMLSFLLGLGIISAFQAKRVEVGNYDNLFIKEWNLWKKLHEKEYRNIYEEISTYQKWMNNYRLVEKHNLEASKKRSSFTTALNKFSYLSTDDIKTIMTAGIRPDIQHDWLATSWREVFTPPQNFKAPSEIDWRKEGYVTDVKDEGECLSSWAFSATGSVEGQHFAKTGKLVSLSEQNLIDCSKRYGNNGCGGGTVFNAFDYIMDHGIDTEKSYPYKEDCGVCEYSIKTIGATISGYRIVMSDEETLKNAVATNGPVSVYVDSLHWSFYHYFHSVYDEPNCSSTEVDHAMLVVGYGSEDGQDYWLVKNNWGTSWGEKGYIKMSRNKNNQCGIATRARLPIV